MRTQTYSQLLRTLTTQNDLSDFRQWDVADRHGWTIAHAMANRSRLPSNFNSLGLWGLADDTGWTVAHTAADRGGLPGNFDRWFLADHSGIKVADIAKDQYAGWKIKMAFDCECTEVHGSNT
jgi:hypothetical protein